MAYHAYNEHRFSPEREKLIALIDSLCLSYQRQGFMLSVRQLYYQLVARDIIPNTERSYQNTAGLINDARMAGLLDWDAIEDRGRDVVLTTRWESGAQIIRASAEGFHQDKWVGQPERVLVIVEKAALAGVLQGVCRKYDVPLLAARGYPSVSILREMTLEHIVPAFEDNQNVTVLHLGDHDPSGIDMTRDIEERITTFIEGAAYNNDCTFEVHRIALTMNQVEEVKPPPNPAKNTDSRFQGYKKLFGDKSWELDALEPNYIVQLVTGEIEALRDIDTWNERVKAIEHIRSELHIVARNFDKKGI